MGLQNRDELYIVATVRPVAIVIVIVSVACTSAGPTEGTQSGGDTRHIGADPGDSEPSGPGDPGAPGEPGVPNDSDGPSDPGPDPDGHASIHYIGRFTSDHRFAWSGSGVVARFSGTGVSVSISGNPNTFEAFIDGTHATTFDSPVASYAIANNLPNGEHLVEVYRRTEAWFGDTRFDGFTVTGGDLVKSPFPFAHQLQFIGDSITCGYGDMGTLDSGCHIELTTESELLAFGALTAQALGAARHVIAWSGKGMWREGGQYEPTPDQMPELYERTIPTEATSSWDHTAYVPDVIVINLGTNDWWVDTDPCPDYKLTYLTFLTHLRALYPEAYIFCTLGPMQNSPPALACLQDIVDAFADTHVYDLVFAQQLGSDGYGCDWHPSQATHQKMATTLEAAIREVTGW